MTRLTRLSLGLAAIASMAPTAVFAGSLLELPLHGGFLWALLALSRPNALILGAIGLCAGGALALFGSGMNVAVRAVLTIVMGVGVCIAGAKFVLSFYSASAATVF